MFIILQISNEVIRHRINCKAKKFDESEIKLCKTIKL